MSDNNGNFKLVTISYLLQSLWMEVTDSDKQKLL